MKARRWAVRLLPLMIIVAIVGSLLGGISHFRANYGRQSLITRNEEMAERFRQASDRYLGTKDADVRAECVRMAEWHESRAIELKQLYPFDFSEEMLRDGQQLEQEGHIRAILSGGSNGTKPKRR
jgi:hypothetical protein